jgi:alpha-amylase/alpha-mannosidase (GH57 family)
MSHLILHGHTYQPPREHPATGRVPVEPTAAPFHDWNERITEECYRPMGWARVTDDGGRIVDIVNLYSLMSFDLGPTLAAWLATNAPDVLDRIVAGDRVGRTAIAHPYHHVIFPLADARDRQTELAWGLADFRLRFGREPAGVWLPETAVDSASLASVADAGVAFVPLMADQVVDGVAGTAGVWRSADGSRSVDIVLADSGFSRGAAFGVFGGSAASLVQRGIEATGPDALGLAITDTETFGHHHKFTERTVAYALSRLVSERGYETGSIEAWLRTTSQRRVMDVQTSSWSCVHGVGRWWRDCACQNGDIGGNQAWRTPLRAALDVVRRSARAAFAHSELFSEPWRARDAYGACLAEADRCADAVGRYLAPGADPLRARLALESQRHALAMYTSCAWFFDDISRIEPINSLRHAACCVDLLEELGSSSVRDEVRAVLRTAISNDPAVGNGADIWDRVVAESQPNANAGADVAAARAPDARMLAAVRLAVSSHAPADIVAAEQLVGHPEQPADLERGQELLFEALVGRGPNHPLAGLGEQVGLAIDQVTHRVPA